MPNLLSTPQHSRIPALWLTVLAAATACGGDGGTGPGDPPGPIDLSGSWISPNRSEAGVPLLRYDITQNGSTLSGEAFRRYEGALERVGPLSGTIDEEGEAHWVTTLNDNGWDGTETVDAQFSGVEVQSLRTASPAVTVASSIRAGTVTCSGKVAQKFAHDVHEGLGYCQPLQTSRVVTSNGRTQWLKARV